MEGMFCRVFFSLKNLFDDMLKILIDIDACLDFIDRCAMRPNPRERDKINEGTFLNVLLLVFCPYRRHQ